jgi:hypothetical protein
MSLARGPCSAGREERREPLPKRLGFSNAVRPTMLLLALCMGGSHASGQAVTRHVREELRLGGLSASEATAFVVEPDLVVDGEGRIYARTEFDIRVFDPDGSLRTILGRRGEGPGEFRSAFAHGILGDTVWVLDPGWRPKRITRFLRDGQLLGTSPAEEAAEDADPARRWRVTRLLQGGQVLAHLSEEVPGGSQGSTRVRIPAAIADRMLSQRTVVGEILFPQGLWIPGLVRWENPLFPVSPLLAVPPDGSGVVSLSWEESEPGVARIQRFDPFGRRTADQRIVSPVLMVPARVVDSLVADGMERAEPVARRQRRRGMDPPANLKRAVREGLLIPRAFPLFREVVAGIDGSIWLRRMRSSGDRNWIVLDSTGAEAFRVDLPAGFTVRQVSLTHVWGTALGAFDAPEIIRFGIESVR